MINKNLSKCGSELTIIIGEQLTLSEFKDFRSAFEHISLDCCLVKVDFNKTGYLDFAALGMLLLLKDVVTAVKGNLVLTFPVSENGAFKLIRAANFQRTFDVIVA